MTYSLEAISQLEHSKEFARLHQKFHQFNPLKVLRVDQFEIRHSNILAWLLDPKETHQLGGFFLKKLLTRLVTRVENEGKGAGIDFLSFLHSSFHDAEVAREVKTHTNRSIDLLVHVPSQKLVLVIENKFHAGESDGQLADYLEFAKLRFSEAGYTILPIFLTLANEEPSKDDYLLLGYEDVLEIIEQQLEFNKETTADAIYDFLSFYMEVLKEQLVHDEVAVQLALEVYEGNKSSIDLLFLSQNKNFKKQAIYKGIYQQIGNLNETEKTALRKIYEAKKKTIDFIFNIGSNVLREAFLEFVKEAEIPEEAYSANIRSPNFVLPDWFDFEETLGKPDSSYWLGQAFIIWFERQVGERLKITVEIGPIPYEERYQLLTMLEAHGVHFQQNAKQEGKKYTRIYTAWTEVKDWASKQEVLKSMLELYDAPKLNELFQKIALSVESMSEKAEAEEIVESEREELTPVRKILPFPTSAFQKFCEEHSIDAASRKYHQRNPSFIVPTFTKLEQRFGTTRINWWWQNGPFLFWFERLRDGRLKLVLELGPLHGDARLALIEELEAYGVNFKPVSKLKTAKYTRLYTNTKVINDWQDENQVAEAMTKLFKHPKHQELLGVIERIAVESSVRY
ncbi:PD-(D/E)XK nuclease family protein [Planomicrobium chinense]|uniref:PDDEXK-like family protein n=1 Tax=Planococcus chinensis TaxID=272917 RepID=UPI001CC41E3B|nr:PD-(D/E)XK nuclease family protein [Planococcus chinensis]MBZ5201567.1 PD-(D/E)XK nuclease family protein [Planococcus chinensis]